MTRSNLHFEGKPADTDGLRAKPLTEDAFLGGRLRIFQPATGFRAGSDAVLLAASVPLTEDPAQSLLDCGAGVGTVGLCAAARCHLLKVVLIEREETFVELARRNIQANNLQGRVRATQVDITAPGDLTTKARLDDNSFTYVVANPPYLVSGQGTSSPDRLKAVGQEMQETDLDIWVRFMVRMAKPGGTLVMIQRAEALDAMLSALEGRFGGVRILPIYPRQGAPAHRVIVTAIKASRGPLSVLPGFVLHDAKDAFTEHAEAVFRHGAALEMF